VEPIQIFGTILFVSVLAFTLWRLSSSKPQAKATHGSNLAIAFILLVTAFFSFACLISDRITLLDIPKIGTLHAVTKQALADAQDVATLKTRVESQSATVDLVAAQATKATELGETASAQIKQAEQRLSLLNNSISEARTTLDSLEQEEEFMFVVLAAQNDDRASFDKLWEFSRRQDYRFASIALQAWVTILDAHASAISSIFPPVSWLSGVDPSKLSLTQLSTLYYTGQTYKPSLLQYIWHRDDISKLDRLDFMMSVMKTDSSLLGAEYAGRYFDEGSNQKFKFLYLSAMTTWWEEHRRDFEAPEAPKP
jgi:hypothetical protein